MNPYRCITQAVPGIPEKLLENDRYTFAVLSLIVKGECRKTVTDDQTFILCHSNEPYPVWVWTVEDITDEELEEVCQLTMKEFPPDHYHYNMKYRAAEWFLAHTENLGISMNMMAYECLKPEEPKQKAAGQMQVCQEKDLQLLVRWMMAFQKEIDLDKKTEEENRVSILDSLQKQSLYFWVDETGKPVCLCGAKESEDGFSRIGPVFTPPEERRHHYAENLVYVVSRQEVDRGYTPILYTNADYAASNGCYQKVGYVCRGTLCTVAEKL